MPVGKGRMGPQHITPGGRVRRFKQVRAAEFLVAARTKVRDDQVSLLVEQEKPVGILHDEGVGPADGFASGSRLKCFPDPFARVRFQAAKLAVTADAIDIALFQKWRTHDGVQMGRVLFALLFRAPQSRGYRPRRVESKHERTIVKASEEQ